MIAAAAGIVITYWGYIWWHPIVVLFVESSLFFSTIIFGYALWRSKTKRGIQSNSNEWRLVPSSVYLRYHVNASSINLAGLDAVDPYVIFTFGIVNGSGRTVVIKSIEGEMSCNGDAAWGYPKLIQSPFTIPADSGYTTYARSFKQTFSIAVKQKMLDRLKDGTTPLAFDFGTVRFVGTVNGQEFELYANSIGRYALKGPFDRSTTADQDNVRLLEPMFASQQRYELWSGNLKQTV